MSFQVQEVINRMGDYLGNYSTGQANTDFKIRAIDSSLNILKRTMTLPQDERIHSFYYSSDNFYYDTPTDFQEALGLYYNAATNNYPQSGLRWEYRPYQELRVRTGNYPGISRAWSHITYNGSHQLMLLGTNQHAGQILDTFDLNLWTASGDASGIAIDPNVKYQGSASQKFNLTYATGTGTLTSPSAYWDFSTLVDNNGSINLYVYFASASVTNVKFRFQSSTGNYYQMTVTTNADGQAFQLNQWNKLTFSTSDAVITGSPVLTSINQFNIYFTIPNTFGTVTGFRVDDLFVTYPDYMDLIYASNIKGTSQEGDEISKLSSVYDNINYDNDFIEPLAIRAALYTVPQLSGDKDFMKLYTQMYVDFVRMWSKQWPKKRTENNFTRTRLGR